MARFDWYKLDKQGSTKILGILPRYYYSVKPFIPDRS